MPSLRNRKVKGRTEVPINIGIVSYSFDGIDDHVDLSHVWPIVTITNDPTIFDYVKSKCFSCGRKTKGKYCCATHYVSAGQVKSVLEWEFIKQILKIEMDLEETGDMEILRQEDWFAGWRGNELL